MSEITLRAQQSSQPTSSAAAEENGKPGTFDPGSVDWNAVGLDRGLLKYWAQVQALLALFYCQRHAALLMALQKPSAMTQLLSAIC